MSKLVILSIAIGAIVLAVSVYQAYSKDKSEPETPLPKWDVGDAFVGQWTEDDDILLGTDPRISLIDGMYYGKFLSCKEKFHLLNEITEKHRRLRKKLAKKDSPEIREELEQMKKDVAELLKPGTKSA